MLYKHWKKQPEVYKIIIIMLQAFISIFSFTSLKHSDGKSLEKCDPVLNFINATSIIQLFFSLLFLTNMHVWPRWSTAISIYLNLNFMTGRWNYWEWHQRRWKNADRLAIRKMSQQYRWPNPKEVYEVKAWNIYCMRRGMGCC